MQNIENWKPSKFIYKSGKLRASRNPSEVGIGSRLMVDIIAKFYDCQIKKHVKGKLLDLGCGKVPLFEVYRDFVSEIICVDWENSLHKNEHLDATINLNLNEDLEFYDREFDTIILSDVLEHMRYPETILKEMYRIINYKGKILINVPFYYWLHEEPNDYFRYTRYALESIVKESGFEIIELNALGGAPEILADIIAKNILVLPIIGKIISLSIQSFTWYFIKTRLGKKISRLTSRKFPIGYYLIAQKLN